GANAARITQPKTAATQHPRSLPRRRKRLPFQRTIRPVLPKRKKIVMPSGVRTRPKPEPTVGTTISNSCPSVCDVTRRPRVRFDLLLLESGALSVQRFPHASGDVAGNKAQPQQADFNRKTDAGVAGVKEGQGMAN